MGRAKGALGKVAEAVQTAAAVVIEPVAKGLGLR